MALKRNKRKGKYWYDDVQPNGKKYGPIYRKRFEHPDGVNRYMQASSSKEWDKKRKQIELDAEKNPSGIVKDYKNATLLIMSIPYLESRETKSIGNYIRVKGHFDRYILPSFKNKIVSKINANDLMTFAKKITKSNGPLVTREVFVVFTAFFHWCVSKKWLTHNPIDDALREYIKDNRKKALKKKKMLENEYPLATHDIERIYEYAKDRREAIVYHFMAHTCRIGEALGVKVKDVNIFKKTLYINHQVQSYPKHMLEGTAFLNDDSIDKNSNTVVLDELKTEESERTEKLLPETVDPLIKLIADKDPDDLIFTTKNGTPCTPDNFRKRYWKPMLRKLGIDHKIKLTPHVMRGFVFSKGVASGQDSALLSKSLGHKNISTTLDSYFPDIEDEDRDTVNPLGHMSKIINNTPTIEDTDNTKDIRSVNNSN